MYSNLATVRLTPPGKTIQIVEIKELVEYLEDAVIYKRDNSYTEYTGQGVTFTLAQQYVKIYLILNNLYSGNKFPKSEFDFQGVLGAYTKKFSLCAPEKLFYRNILPIAEVMRGIYRKNVFPGSLF